MKNQTLNEQISRIKSVMGLNEQEEQFLPATKLIYKGYRGSGGMGTDEKSLVSGFQLIKSQSDYKTVESQIAQYGAYKTLIDVLNGELGSDDLITAQQIQAALKVAGVNIQFDMSPNTATNGGNNSYLKEKTFKIGQAVASGAAAQVAKNGWWDKHPALLAYLKDTTQVKLVHYPLESDKDTGAITSEKTNNLFWDFFVDGKFYIFKTLDDALKGVNQSYSGTWKENGNVLNVSTTDGETWNSTSKTWTKPKPKMQWVKETGKFPLMYGQYGTTIQTLQRALGLKGDAYFGNVTEKYILSKAPEYKRESGVTDDIYNKIVNASKPAQTQQTNTPPTDAELQASPNTLNPY